MTRTVTRPVTRPPLKPVLLPLLALLLVLLAALPAAAQSAAKQSEAVRKSETVQQRRTAEEERRLDTARVVEPQESGQVRAEPVPATLPVRKAEAQRLLREAVELETRGDIEAAIRHYGVVDSLAEAGLDGETEARYALQFANLMEQRVAAPADPASVSETHSADVLYRRVIAVGTPQQAALARNNLANRYLQQGDAATAGELFQDLDLDVVPEQQRFVYRYNTGRALEVVGEEDRAFEIYLRVLEEQPAFVPAAEAAWRTLRALGDRVEQAERFQTLGRSLLDAGQLRTFDDLLVQALETFPSPDVLNLLVQRWARRPLETDAEAEAVVRRLTGIVEEDEATSRYLLSLRRALSDRSFAAAAERGVGALWELSSSFANWRRIGGGAALADLLVRLAEADRNRGAAAAALGRTFVAWALDPDNTRAAVDCAAALRARPDLDPEGRIQREIEDLFQNRGRAYATHDLRNILRLHLLLASIFEKEGTWGSSSERRSVIFQLEHALRAERELGARDDDFVPSPGLHRRLAEAYAAVGEPTAAFDHYLRAARAFAELERVDDADRMVKLAGAVDLPPDSERDERLAETAAIVRNQRLAVQEKLQGQVGSTG